jgi:hypothetical protein
MAMQVPDVPRCALRPTSEELCMRDVKSLVIGALIVAVAVLGYVLWERQRNTVEIRLPSVTIEKN